MRHPTEGVLRRLLDEPHGVPLADRTHVATCDACARSLDLLGAEADLVGAALAPPSLAGLDAEAALARLSAAPVPSSRRTPRPRRSLRTPAAAAVAVAVVLAGAGTAAANDWLQVFRTEQVAPVSITTADLVQLPDLAAYGELDLVTQPDVRSVPDAETAGRLSGLEVPQVDDLPSGVRDAVVYQVGSKASATFTFTAERARAAAGEALPPLPPGLDGATVRLDAGPGVAAVWTSESGTPALVVGRAVAPTAFSTGVPFETVRDYLLSLPGLPDEVADQLRTFTADGSTLPLPVPADQVETTTADVDGVRATVLSTRDRSLAAVVRVEDGVVTVVAGALDTDEVLAVARDLQ